MKKVLVAMLVMAFVQISYGQNFKFGKVSKEELKESFCPIDSTANAAYLYKKRSTYTSINAGGIKLITEVQVRLKIYNQEGFNWSTVEISLYGSSNNSGEKVTGLKAVTYNLDGGEIQETKLEKDDIFNEQKSENWKIKKFTMPNVKEGSVLEWTYKLVSPYVSSIDDVIVQEEIPIKKLDARVKLLEWFFFNKRQKGYYSFNISESSKFNNSLKTNDKEIAVLQDNIPALKAEPYVNNMSNYAASLQFEVASLSAPEYGLFENYSTNWNEVAKSILKSSSFGGELKKTKHLKEDIAKLNETFKTEQTKISGALEFVKNKIKWNGNYGKYSEKGLKKAYSEGVGNIGDINLTLVAVLRELGIKANPVLVSTRKHGIPITPTTRGFNYVIALAEIGEEKILLDASEKYSLANVLPIRALNWRGTVIREDESADFIDLATSILSNQEYSINYKINEEGLIAGITRVKYENLATINYRNNNADLDEDELISNIEQQNDDIEILNYRVSNLNEISKPVLEMYQFEKEDGVELIGDKMYLSPLLFFTEKENPFKLEKREYPIDYGSPWQKKVVVGFEIPEGYSVESLPEDLAVGLSNNIGKYIYSIKQIGNKISLTSLFVINQGVVPAQNYQEIKGFYKMVVNKNLEKIVLNKI